MLIKLSRKSKAQTTAEYAILLGLVIGAVVAMQVYVKRTLQGRAHRAVQYMAVNSACATIGFGNATQYEPYYLTQDVNVNRAQNAQQNLYTGGTYNAFETATTNRTGGYTSYSNVVQE